MKFIGKMTQYVFLVGIITLILNTNNVSSTVVTLRSGSNYTGVNTTYYFSISSHNNPSKLTI